MGVESGDAEGRVPPSKNQRETFPRTDDISVFFFLQVLKFYFPNIFKIPMVAEIRGETQFWG